MPLLEIVQTRRITAMIRLDETTASQIDQYAAFLHATADEVVDKALVYVFAKDRDFQDYLRTPESANVPPSLRVRHFGQNGTGREAVNGAGKRPNGSVAGHDSVAAKRAAGVE